MMIPFNKKSRWRGPRLFYRYKIKKPRAWSGPWSYEVNLTYLDSGTLREGKLNATVGNGGDGDLLEDEECLIHHKTTFHEISNSKILSYCFNKSQEAIFVSWKQFAA
jgi:hypothetical protein